MKTMSQQKQSDVIWLNTSPSLSWLSQPLLNNLSHHITISKWKYTQSPDEASSINVAIEMLDNYLQSNRQSVHLIGHSTGGLLGLLYTHKYPEKVKSLTLLAVGADAALDWQAHYYMYLPFLNRQKILTTMVYNLFGYQHESTAKSLEKILEQDLDCSLSPHSLFKTANMPISTIPVPLLVCGSTNDIIVESEALQGWEPYLKEGDRLWKCQEGWHFFHFFQPNFVAEQILDFWQSLYHLDSVCTYSKVEA